MKSFKVKLAITRAMKEVRRAYNALGKTRADRLHAVSNNPRAIPILNKLQDASKGYTAKTTANPIFPRLSGQKNLKTTDVSRRKIDDIPYAGKEHGAQNAGLYLGSHPDFGTAVTKRLKPRKDAKTGEQIFSARQALDKEMSGASIVQTGNAALGVSHPNLWRPRVVRTGGVKTQTFSPTQAGKMGVDPRRKLGAQPGRELGSGSTGQGLQVVGSGETARLNLNDPFVRTRLGLMPGKKYRTRSGKVVQRKPDTDFMDELEELQLDRFDDGFRPNPEGLAKLERFGGVKPQSQDMVPSVFSEYVSRKPGGMAARQEDVVNMLNWMDHMRRKQRVVWGDGHQGNITYQNLFGQRSPISVFDFGVARKATQPLEATPRQFAEANLRTMTHPVPMYDKFGKPVLDFPSGAQRFMDEVLSKIPKKS
tara:strand:+ start:2737 stop:4002 length:1266 start_codon:yes stop_codon:yes gene_type:complete